MTRTETKVKPATEGREPNDDQREVIEYLKEMGAYEVTHFFTSVSATFLFDGEVDGFTLKSIELPDGWAIDRTYLSSEDDSPFRVFLSVKLKPVR